MMTVLWADEIQRLTPAERARTTAYSPFIPDPESGRLFLFNEMRRRGGGFPVGPAPGWVTIAHGAQMWCPIGAEGILSGRERPRRLIGPDRGRLDLNHEIIVNLVLHGRAFVFLGDLFMLPDQPFELNSFNYELTEPEPLSVFIGYRGHPERYDQILSPGLLRECSNPTEDKILHYKRRETYAGNVLKEAFWKTKSIALDDIQARGILQHHGTLGSTDILDLTYDINVAKWFALNRWHREEGRYVTKHFQDLSDEEGMLDNASYVYTVVVRVLGGTRDPLAMKVKEKEVRLLPWNLNFLWSTRPMGQRGFGLLGIGRRDQDMYGAVLNVIEHRYHPHAIPNGWEAIGGPSLSIDGTTYSALADSSVLQSRLFPDEERWFAEALDAAKAGAMSIQ